jgi:GNAT superfamily N-acetyltransferase
MSVSKVRHPLHNWVYLAQFESQEAEKRIEEIVAFYRQRRAPFSWTVGPLTQPDDLGERLLAKHFRHAGTFLGLSLDLQTEWSSGENKGPLQIHSVQTTEEMARFLELSDRDYQSSDFERLLQARISRLQQPLPTLGYLLAYWDNKLAGVASYKLNRYEGVIHFADSYVHPSFRKRGIYRALVDYRVQIGKECHCRVALTEANEKTSAPILIKWGFQKLCVLKDYLYLHDSVLEDK